MINDPNSISVNVQNLSFSYVKGENVIDTSSFQIKKGDLIALTGLSGTGKSTIGYILKGIIPHSIHGYLQGSVMVEGYDIKKEKISTIAKRVGMVFQNPETQIFSSTVLEEIQFGLKNLKMDLTYAHDALKSLKIEHLANKMPMNLSAGQKQHVVLASVIATKPKLLILDEPTSHLDAPSKVNLKNWLLDLCKQGMTIIIIDQDPWIIGELCENCLFIENKRIKIVRKEEIMHQDTCWRWNF
jgi:energy-coupling factor transporter ATP-binding protein EcfA2